MSKKTKILFSLGTLSSLTISASAFISCSNIIEKEEINAEVKVVNGELELHAKVPVDTINFFRLTLKDEKAGTFNDIFTDGMFIGEEKTNNTGPEAEKIKSFIQSAKKNNPTYTFIFKPELEKNKKYTISSLNAFSLKIDYSNLKNFQKDFEQLRSDAQYNIENKATKAKLQKMEIQL